MMTSSSFSDPAKIAEVDRFRSDPKFLRMMACSGGFDITPMQLFGEPHERERNGRGRGEAHEEERRG
jgi:hypothetical protein